MVSRRFAWGRVRCGLVRDAAWADAGQGTVEAAFVLPVLLIALLLLIQPGILLYDRIVMENAAAEGCRLLATKTDAFGDADGSCEAFVRHRLAAIPPVDCFHMHDGGCTWDIAMNGGEKSKKVTVAISTKVKPLPLFDGGATLAGLVDGDGALTVKVERSMPTQPDWVADVKGGKNPKSWIGAW
jgi:Flp pilus assembly protein TadG